MWACWECHSLILIYTQSYMFGILHVSTKYLAFLSPCTIWMTWYLFVLYHKLLRMIHVFEHAFQFPCKMRSTFSLEFREHWFFRIDGCALANEQTFGEIFFVKSFKNVLPCECKSTYIYISMDRDENLSRI